MGFHCPPRRPIRRALLFVQHGPECPRRPRSTPAKCLRDPACHPSSVVRSRIGTVIVGPGRRRPRARTSRDPTAHPLVTGSTSSSAPWQHSTASACVLNHAHFFSAPSIGAPVPEEPKKKSRPSANVISRPLATGLPLLARKPFTTISLPGTKSVFLRPLLMSAFVGPVSTRQFTTVPPSPFTSM